MSGAVPAAQTQGLQALGLDARTGATVSTGAPVPTPPSVPTETPVFHAPVETPAPSAPPDVTAAAETSAEAEPEENIYEVMKQHMVRQKEEQEVKNAQMRQQHPHGRPQPHPAAPPPVEKAADLSDLEGVWIAARNFLSQNARLLESVLGASTKIEMLNTAGAEVTLAIPNTHRNFTNDRARAKLEEALRAVTDLPLKLLVNFVEPPDVPAGAYTPNGGGGSSGPLAAAQRIPPELMEAVKNQPVVRELMKRLDATVTHVEILDAKDEIP